MNQVENEVIWGEAGSVDSVWGMGFVLAIISTIDTAGNQWIEFFLLIYLLLIYFNHISINNCHEIFMC